MKKLNTLLSFVLATALLSAAASATAAPADFTVTAPADGQTFKLSQARGKFVALHFLLKTECPFCLRHTAEYSMKAPTVAGVTHIFLKPDADDEIKAWSRKIKGTAQPVIYRDPDAALARSFNIPDGYSFHGQSIHYPAFVLIDPNGKEVFRYVGKSNTDRYPWDKFAAKIDELTATPAVREYNLPADKVAVSGFDPVAYFTDGKAERGNPEITSGFRGAKYRFANARNQALFAADPAKYTPTYGGWCATAMAKGKKVEIDPANFKVTNGRLYLFYNGLFANARTDWDRNEPEQIGKADVNWKKFSGE